MVAVELGLEHGGAGTGVTRPEGLQGVEEGGSAMQAGDGVVNREQRHGGRKRDRTVIVCCRVGRKWQEI